MHDKFTERVRKVIYLAREEAARLQHDYIGTEHLLLGVIREGEGIAATVLNNLGVDLDHIRQAVENMVTSSGGTMTIGEIPFTPRAKRVLELAVEEARSLGHNYVGTEHLLLGLIREGEGVAAKVLLELGVDRKRVREETLKLLGGTPSNAPAEREERAETPALNQFGRDLTALAQAARPVSGARSSASSKGRAARRTTRCSSASLASARPRSPRAWHPHRREQGTGDFEKAHRHARPRRRGRGHEMPRPIRGAAQDRDERDPRVEGHDHLHRQLHHRRAGAEGAITPRTCSPRSRAAATVHRRDHARRVPQVHREGRRLERVPADHGRPALGR
jgi:hypothetical protein